MRSTLPAILPSPRNVVVSARDLAGAITRARRAGAHALAQYLAHERKLLRGTTATHATIRVGADELDILRR